MDEGIAPQNCFRIFDQETFEVIDTLPLDSREEGLSILSTRFADDPSIYFVIGTAYVYDKEQEPSKGRILVVQFAHGHAELIAEKEVKGAVFTLNEMQVL